MRGIREDNLRLLATERIKEVNVKQAERVLARSATMERLGA